MGGHNAGEVASRLAVDTVVGVIRDWSTVGAQLRTEVHVLEAPLVGGELLVLTTDGVHGVLDDERLESLVREEDQPREIAERIVAAALTRGSRDNCTAIVARYIR